MRQREQEKKRIAEQRRKEELAREREERILAREQEKRAQDRARQGNEIIDIINLLLMLVFLNLVFIARNM